MTSKKRLDGCSKPLDDSNSNRVSHDGEAKEQGVKNIKERMSGVHKNTQRAIHSINPLGMRVVVKITKDLNVTDGGLYLPEGAKEKMDESLLAEVIEVAHAIDEDTDEETNVSGIPLGALVLIPKSVGVRVPWDDQLRIVETIDVLAMVDRMNVT